MTATKFKILILLLFASIVSTSALADEQKESIPKEFIKIRIPYGVSSIDLRGTGKAEDWAVVGSTIAAMTNPEIFSFLTKAENDPEQKYHFVEMPDNYGRGISFVDTEETDCIGRLTFFLRDAANPQKIYMLTTKRSAQIEPNVDVSFKIDLYSLDPGEGAARLVNGRNIKPSENVWYRFNLIKSASVPSPNSSHQKCTKELGASCIDDQAACSDEQIRKLEEETLKIKVKG
jgi:hypothetical protein